MKIKNMLVIFCVLGLAACDDAGNKMELESALEEKKSKSVAADSADSVDMADLAAPPETAAAPIDSIEETIVRNNFINIVTAETFDRLCQDGKVAKAQGEGHYLYENLYALGGRLGALMQQRTPDESAEEAADRLMALRDATAVETKDMIAADGCDSAKAAEMAAALERYNAAEPKTLDALIDKELVNQHGETAAHPDGSQPAAQNPDMGAWSQRVRERLLNPSF